MASRRSGKADSLRLARNVDTAAIAMRLQDGIGNHLRRQSMIEAGHRLSALDNRRDEFPHQVVAKHCCWLACRRVARAPCRLKKFLRHGDGCEILTSLAEQNCIWLMQLIDGRRLAAVDFRPFMSESFAAVSL